MRCGEGTGEYKWVRGRGERQGVELLVEFVLWAQGVCE